MEENSQADIEAALIKEAARKKLAVYIPTVHRTADGLRAFPPSHLKNIVIPALENDGLGHTVIVAPPASAKTNTMVAAACWWIGKNPNIHIGYISSTADQATRRSLAVRDTISSSKEYHALFPDIKPNLQKGWASDQWYVERDNAGDKDPTFWAMGVDGPVLGARFDLIILDDIADQRNMATLFRQEKVKEWLGKSLMTRLTAGGRAILIATRWAENDPVAWAQSQGWHYIHIPAIKEEDDKEISYWPEVWPVEKLRCPNLEHPPTPCCKYKESGGAFNFAQQYQGVVQDEKSSLLKRSYWDYYDELPEGLDIGGIFVDAAHATNSNSDFSVVLLMYKDNVNFYIQDIYRGKVEFPALKAKIARMQMDTNLPVFIENTPGGLPLIQELKLTVPKIFAWNGGGKNKIARVQSNLSYFEAGNVKLRKGALWIDDLLNEASLFPAGEHDDMVDAVTMGIITLKSVGVKWTVA